MTDETKAPKGAARPVRRNPFISVTGRKPDTAGSIRNNAMAWAILGCVIVWGFILVAPSELSLCRAPSRFVVQSVVLPMGQRFCVYAQVPDGSPRRTDICAAQPEELAGDAQVLAAAAEQNFEICKAQAPSLWQAAWLQAKRLVARTLF